MSTSDTLQFVSFAAVAVALLLNYLQARQVARQTAEVARQTRAVTLTLEQNAHHELVRHGADFHAFMLTGNADLLDWFLASRGIVGSLSADQSRRRMYLFMRLDIHESNFLAHSHGSLSDEVWTSWHNVLSADCATDEFVELWPLVRKYYTSAFVGLVDELSLRGSLGAEPSKQSGECSLVAHDLTG